jgi:hypothetical protein
LTTPVRNSQNLGDETSLDLATSSDIVPAWERGKPAAEKSSVVAERRKLFEVKLAEARPG